MNDAPRVKPLIHPVIHRSTKLALEIVGFLIGGLVILVALAAWRLSVGPLEIDFLTPYIEDALSDEAVHLSIGSASLRWDGFERPLSLVATGVVMRGDAGALVARVPAMTVSLSVRNLLRGRLMPRRLELVEPSVRVERTEEGAFRFAIGEDLAEAAPNEDVLALLLGALQAPPGTDHPLAALTDLDIRGARVTVDDRMLGFDWYAPRADIALHRMADGIRGNGRLDVAVGERTARLDATLRYAFADRFTDIQLRLNDVVPADLAGLDPVLTPLRALASPVGGTIALRLSPTFIPRETRFALAAGEGVLRLSDLYAEPLPVTSLVLAGNVDLLGGVLRVERFAADLGGPRLDGFAMIRDEAGLLDVVGDVALYDMPTDRLADYWPRGVAQGAREWIIENLSGGQTRQIGASLHARARADDLQSAELVSLAGDLTFDGLSLIYLEGLPPVTDIAGSGSFDETTFRLTMPAGNLEKLKIVAADVVISGLDQPQELIAIDVVTGGPVATALTVLDSPRLGYASEIGIDPEQVTGDMAARLRFAFPLERDLLFEDVAIGAAATLQDVNVGGILSGIDAEDTDGTLRLDGDGMQFKGTTRLNGVPASFGWQENFGAEAEIARRLTVAGTLDEAALVALDLPTYPGLSGPVAAEAVYTAHDAGSASAAVELDLTAARLALDPIGWVKDAGVPGAATLDLELKEDVLRRIPSFWLRAADLTATGNVAFASEGQVVAEANVTEISYGRSRFGLHAVRRPDSGYTVEVRGAALDASLFFEDLIGDDEQGVPPPAPASEPDDGPPAPLQVTIAVDEVIVGDDRSLYQTNGVLVRRGDDWDMFDIAALTDTSAPVRLRFGETPESKVRLSLTAEDAGAALRTFDLADTVQGGQLLIVGQRVPTDADSGTTDLEPGTAFVGEVRLERFRVVRVPVLARLLAALSLSGLNDLLTTDGIDFRRLTANYRLDDGILAIADARTSGGSLGLTLEGNVDLNQNRIEVQGTIVPLSGVNRVIGAIPLIGDMLTGGEGQGVFAFTYRVEGSLDDPEVTVNPLAVLAPGFLRNLFFLDRDTSPG